MAKTYRGFGVQGGGVSRGANPGIVKDPWAKKVSGGGGFDNSNVDQGVDYGAGSIALDIAQVVIGLGGGIPLIGNLLDGLNAGISLRRGDKLGATIDGLSAIPGAGQVAGALGIARRGKRLAAVGRRLVQRYGPTVTASVVRAKSLVANFAQRTASAASGAAGRIRAFFGGATKRTVSKIDDITKPGSKLPNIKTDVPKSEFEKNLRDNGFVKSTSKDGNVNIFSSGSKKFTTRDFSKSTNGPTAEVFKNNRPVSRIRLGDE